MSLPASLPEDDLPGRVSQRAHLGPGTGGHDEAGRCRLRWRICGSAGEALRSFAAAHGVSEAALVDALVHALATADAAWLEEVVGRARGIDHRRRRRVRQAP